MSNQFPHREAAHAPFDPLGWQMLQRDVDKLFRSMQIMKLDEDNLSASGAPTFASITVTGNITVAGTVDGVDVSDHKTTHENGGSDEISVAGLSGLLADDQNPTAHKADHENGGGDEISVAGLSGELADDQPAKIHALDADTPVDADEFIFYDAAGHNNKVTGANLKTYIGSASMDIHGLTADTPADADELPFYDTGGAHNNKVTVEDFKWYVGAKVVSKSIDESVASSTVLQDDDELQFSMAAGGTYTFRMGVFWGAAAVCDIKFSINGPASPTDVRVVFHPDNYSGYEHTIWTAYGSVLTILTDGNDHFAMVCGTITNGVNAGTFALQFAQNTSRAAPDVATVRRGSFLWARRTA